MAFHFQNWLFVYKSCISFTNIQLSFTNIAFQFTKWHLILLLSLNSPKHRVCNKNIIKFNKNLLINDKRCVILYIEIKREVLFMKRYSTIFLKIFVILIAIPVLALCIFWVPGFVGYLPLPIIIGVYATATTYFFALYQALKLLTYIDKNKAFSELSVKALKNIKYCANIISVIYAVLIPFLFPIADVDDAPGLIGFPIIIVFASTVIAVFAAVLQRLLQDAIDIKSENDLTV